MAHHKSAKKRIRRNERAKIQNGQYISAVRTAVKKFRLAIDSVCTGVGDKTALQPLFVNAQSMLSKAATKGILHKNNVSRRVGRLSAMLHKAETTDATTVQTVTVKASGAAKKKRAAAKKSKAAASKKKK